MICDTSKITMPDGETVPVIDLFPGRSIISPRITAGIAWQMAIAPIKDRKVEIKNETHRLLLANGESLTATADQLVATRGTKRTQYRDVEDIAIGDLLVGERAGVRVSMEVVATQRSTDPVRCVSLDTGGQAYVAEGVLCR